MSRMRYGIYAPLEEEADRLIRESLQGVTAHSAKADILTPWKQAERWRREVYCADGVPDPATRKGMFKRALNTKQPELNSRDGVARPRRGAPRSPAVAVDDAWYNFEVAE